MSACVVSLLGVMMPGSGHRVDEEGAKLELGLGQRRGRGQGQQGGGQHASQAHRHHPHQLYVDTPGIVMGSPDSSRYTSMLSRVPSLPNCHVSLLCIRASNKSLDRDQGFYSHTTLDWIGGNHKLLPADWTSIGSISIRNTIA